jgi:hypothetical protein
MTKKVIEPHKFAIKLLEEKELKMLNLEEN